MEELVILKYQLRQIEDAFRKVANVLHCQKLKSCLDRDVMQAWEHAQNALNKTPYHPVERGNPNIQ